MNEDKARDILERSILDDDGLHNGGWYLDWRHGDDKACLDGEFDIEDLEAIVWWMKNK